jgi:carbonic anhydrase
VAEAPPLPDASRGEPADEFARLLAENERFSETFDRSRLNPAPMSGLAVVTCMDARIDVEDVLGLRIGDAHVIRNAGAVVTDDVVRSLIISQQFLGTDLIALVAHTRCGLLGADEQALRDRLGSASGQSLDLSFGAFADLESHVRDQVALLRSHPWLNPVPVRGLIYDVATGRLQEVS